MNTLYKVIVFILIVCGVYGISFWYNQSRFSIDKHHQESDINEDGVVDLRDVSILLSDMDQEATTSSSTPIITNPVTN